MPVDDAVPSDAPGSVAIDAESTTSEAVARPRWFVVGLILVVALGWGIRLAYVWFWLPVLMLLDRTRLATLWTRLAPQAPLLLIFSALYFLLLLYGGSNTYIYMTYLLPVAILVMAYLLEDGRPHWLELVLITVCVVLFNRDFSSIPLPEVDLDRYLRYLNVSLLGFSELLACVAAAVLLRRLLLIFNISRPNSNTTTLSALR